MAKLNVGVVERRVMLFLLLSKLLIGKRIEFFEQECNSDCHDRRKILSRLIRVGKKRANRDLGKGFFEYL